jgi:hypothetical protein
MRHTSKRSLRSAKSRSLNPRVFSPMKMTPAPRELYEADAAPKDRYPAVGGTENGR